jgi:hypothetical protein
VPAGCLTDVGARSGPILWRDRLFALAVLEACDNTRPVGVGPVHRTGPDRRGALAISVHDVELPGLRVVINREFRPAQ